MYFAALRVFWKKFRLAVVCMCALASFPDLVYKIVKGASGLSVYFLLTVATQILRCQIRLRNEPDGNEWHPFMRPNVFVNLCGHKTDHYRAYMYFNSWLWHSCLLSSWRSAVAFAGEYWMSEIRALLKLPNHTSWSPNQLSQSVRFQNNALSGSVIFNVLMIVSWNDCQMGGGHELPCICSIPPKWNPAYDSHMTLCYSVVTRVLRRLPY